MAQLSIAYAAACVLLTHVLQQRRTARTAASASSAKGAFDYDGPAPPATSPQPSQLLPVVRHPRVQHDLMLRMAMARSMHECGRVPVWAMRQAGRYLPEFRALRGHTDFFTRVRTPALACELTLQPLRRFPSLLDAVVIFSDILIIPIAMGCAVHMIDGRGPVLPRPIACAEDVDRLQLAPDAHVAFDYLFNAIATTRREIRRMAGMEAGVEAVPGLKGREVPIIGFVGGPFTLLAYMIEGGGTKDFNKTKAFILKFPGAAHRLLSALTDVAIECAAGQVAAGASILQVFESNAGELPPALFSEYALPYLRRIGSALKRCTDGAVPLIVFPRAAHHALEDMVDSDYDVIGLDWGFDPGDAVRRVVAAASACGRSRAPALQGNLDPGVLFAPHSVIAARTKEMMRGFGDHPLIGNLGHGMVPSHDPEALRAYFVALHSTSEEMCAAVVGKEHRDP